jgi:hypothetical protein
MPAMSGCVALTSIDLGYNKLTAEGLEPFCSNPPPNLTKLEMQSCGLQGTYLGQPVLRLTHISALPRTMSQLKALQKLYVGGNQLQYSDVEFIIESFPQLIELGINNLGLTGRFSHFAKVAPRA